MLKMLSKTEIDSFIERGFIKLDNAFPSELAVLGREILWKDMPSDPNDRSTWKLPVVRLGHYTHEPFRNAVNTPILHESFDQLVGKGRWLPRGSLGLFPFGSRVIKSQMTQGGTRMPAFRAKMIHGDLM